MEKNRNKSKTILNKVILGSAAIGTQPTVTDKTGSAVTLGNPTTITLVNGVSTAGGSLVAYKAEGPVTLHVTDGSHSDTSPGGSGATLTVSPAAASQIRVETAADGSGTVVPTESLNAGVSATGFSISRDTFGNFVANAAADTWTMVNSTGGVANGDLVAAGDKKSAVFTGHCSGTGQIQAAKTGLTSLDSGALTVTDNIPPVIAGCPGNITVNTGPGHTTCDQAATWTAPIASDNCGVTSFTSNHHPGDVFPVGTTTVTYTALDAANNTTSCSFTVTVNDTTPPTITAPANLTDVPTDPGACSTAKAHVALGTPTTADNCGVASVVNDAPASFPKGTTTVTWTVTDTHGNTATATQQVTVKDHEPPTITAPADLADVATDPGKCSTAKANVTLGTPITADNCGVASVANNAPDPFPHGTTTVTWTVTDTSGNTAMATQKVTVQDHELPTITCPANITTANDAGKCSAAVTVGTPTVSDNCGATPPLGVRSDNLPLSDPYPVGLTTITWTETDIHNNTATCNQTVTVKDTEKPVVHPPANVAVNNDAGQCSASVSFTASPTDNCGVATTVYKIGTTVITSPNVFPVGLTTVDVTVTDIHNNSASASFTVTVSDNEKPVIACPANISVNNDAGNCSAAIIVPTPVTSDNCGVASVINSFNNTANASGTYPSGTTVVNWTVTDIHGNTASCTEKITVTDSELPKITQPSDITVNNDPGRCSAAVTVPVPATSDNCGVASVINTFNNTANASGTYPVGTTTVKWTVTDIHGNTASCSQNITVIDVELPKITCPANQTVHNDSGKCGAVVNVGIPVTSDNCGVAAVTGVRSDAAKLTDAYPVGTTLITWTVIDVHNNSAFCTQAVTVNDTEFPIVTTSVDRTVVADVNLQGTVPDFTLGLVASDNCGIYSIVQTPLPGTKVGIGSTIITITATDTSGNSTACHPTFKVQCQPAGASCNGNPGHTILQPVNADGTSVFKQGSTVPLKFMVFDANCDSIGTPGVVSGFTLVSATMGASAIDEAIVSTTPDTAFRWNPTGQQWIFNLSTKNLTKNYTYVYRITLNDASTIQFSFGLK